MLGYLCSYSVLCNTYFLLYSTELEPRYDIEVRSTMDEDLGMPLGHVVSTANLSVGEVLAPAPPYDSTMLGLRKSLNLGVL